MAKGYWIVRVDITDQEKYKSYIAANAEPLKKYGARFLVRGGPFENPEGTSRTRNAVIELPTYQAAIDCWKSPEYQQAIKFSAACVNWLLRQAPSGQARRLSVRPSTPIWYR